VPDELDDLDDDLLVDDEDDVWPDDAEPLPVIRSDGTTEKAPDEPRPRRTRNAPPPKRANARVEDIDSERRQNLENAKSGGRLVDPTSDEWRQMLKDGNRNRAANLLTSESLTHRSDSSFGLAYQMHAQSRDRDST
jgi:hypothetical protein